LYDITIYYHGHVIKDAPSDWNFRRTVNYISDFYHNGLDGYKPANTGRICINLGATKNHDNPSYVGSICRYDSVIDEHKYLSLSKQEKYKYILDILHSTVSEIAEIYHWDQEVFDNSYNQIIESEFKFEKFYPEKRSLDRKHTGQIILVKTEDRSILYTLVTGAGVAKRKIILEKKNWYWYDSVYKLAKSCKWLDNSSFGLYKGEKNCYYSTENDEIITDLVFEKNDF